MTTHVFIVDWQTFDIHLRYLFAGTGSQRNIVDFNNCANGSLHHGKERNLVGMIADANRIRANDQIIFYLQQPPGNNIYEGKFFGVFQSLENGAFLDNFDDDQYLQTELGKSLTFRTMIAPLDVYAEGVTEWEALDEIQHLSSPCQMLWSLIYRKLKGMRGNTMITLYEAERLLGLIRNKNRRKKLKCNSMLSFDCANQKIICSPETRPDYIGRRESIEILPRLMAKHARNQAFEVHLQAYITQHLGKSTNESLDAALLDSGTMEWLGNEVSCGVGMQRIDVMISVKHDNQRCVLPIELKQIKASVENLRQLQRYIDWIKQYYVPNQPSDIQPVLLTKRFDNKESETYLNLIESFKTFNQNNGNDCCDLRYVEFDVSENGVIFHRIEY